MRGAHHFHHPESLCLRRVDASERALLLQHLQDLPPDDRRLRFGTLAWGPIERYVNAVDFGRDSVLAVVSPMGNVLGAAHIAMAGNVAELGLSVAPQARRHRIGACLAEAGLQVALRADAAEFRFQFTSGNSAMRRIAKRLGMSIERDANDLFATRRLRKSPAIHRGAVASPSS